MAAMTIEGGPRFTHLFDEVLQHPSPPYALADRLTSLCRDRAVLVADSGFDIDDFVAAGHATSSPRPDVGAWRETWWTVDGTVGSRARTVWSLVTWQGDAYEVVQVVYPRKFGNDGTCHAVIGPDRARAEAFYAAVRRWNHEVRGEVLVFNQGCFRKSEPLFASIAAARFDQLVLAGSLAQQIRADCLGFLAAREAYAEAGVPWRRGALFIGPPGNGKTLCLKALVRELGVPCLYVQSFEAQYHAPQALVEAVFRRARDQAPCVLVLEDLDALLVPSARAFFLNELDGFAQNAGIITLATTNHPERLDASIVERPSRFDRKYHFELPDAATRLAYLALWNTRLRPALRFDDAGRARIAEATHGFSFAYLQELVVAATMQYVDRAAEGMLVLALEQLEVLRAQMTRGTRS